MQFISLSCDNDVAMLQIDDRFVAVTDYKIVSSMQGGTELTVTIRIDGDICDFTEASS